LLILKDQSNLLKWVFIGKDGSSSKIIESKFDKNATHVVTS